MMNKDSTYHRHPQPLRILNMLLKKCVFIFSISFIVFANPALSQTSSYTDQDCLACHGKPESFQILSNGKARPIFVNPEEWSQDIHHKGKLTCVDCHLNANPFLHFREGFIKADCARCHPEEAEEYQKNIHLTFAAPSPGKELPQCFHCHTKHHVLRHDDPSSSVYEQNIGATCLACHAEVMVKSILKGTSLGKISGHRKGDISEKFEMKVCINCHYDDSAHGAKRAYKEFCVRCHDVRNKGNLLLGPTHLGSKRWTRLNYAGGALTLFLIVTTLVFVGYRTRKGMLKRIKSWQQRMKVRPEERQAKEKNLQEKS
jgi:hypothetical protein